MTNSVKTFVKVVIFGLTAVMQDFTKAIESLVMY